MSQPTQAALRLEVLDGNIGLLTMEQPGSRANTLGQPVLDEFTALMQELAKRTDLSGLILRSGKPGMFIAGADLRELGSVRPDPDTTRRLVRRGLDVIAAFESLPYPTVAAIDGACMGGGLELALGFDYRLASTNPKTELGQPEVKVGLIPGWGGTQRLTRIIGPALAAEMICTGEPVKADRARQLGLVFDAVPPERLLDEARRLIDWANTTGAWREARKRKQQPVGLTEEQAAFTFAVARAQVLARAGSHYPAPPAALDAIARGCNLPLADGLQAETEAFVPLAGSPTSRNLIAVFFLTQRLQKDPGVSGAAPQPRPVNQVGEIGRASCRERV